MNSEKCYVDTRQAAKVLGYSERHVRGLSKQGLLKSTKTGGRWKIPLSSIDEFQKQQKELVSREAQVFKLLKPYVLLYLGTVGQQIQEAGNETLELQAQPVVDDYSKKRMGELQDKLEGLNRYYAKILTILKEAEA
ncbi:MAG: helix-turn-helix domain-containing protein [Planctomycetota bacterium]|jgi:excisionase family DNA binding protein